MEHAPIIEKHCRYEACSLPLRRGRNESRRDFGKRQFCNPDCFHAAHPRQPRIHRKVERPPGLVPCLCGLLTVERPCQVCRLEVRRGRRPWPDAAEPEIVGMFVRAAMVLTHPRGPEGSEGCTWLTAVLDRTIQSPINLEVRHVA